jgi:hypothetical protein
MGDVVREINDRLSLASGERGDYQRVEVDGLADSDPVERQNWIRYKGVRICFRDVRYLYGEEAMRIVSLQMRWLRDTKFRDIRLLLDITGGVVDRKVLGIYKQNARDYKDKFHRIAVIGATGLLEYFCTVVISFSGISARFFDSPKEALDWLAE